ncbi:MAG: phosphotransferase [Phycisphaerae bacterium]|nr:phosphotransferase [Phycisphaerae bacterium]
MSSEDRLSASDPVVHGGGLSPREISAVLSQFSIGEVESIRPFLAGSTRAPKARVTTESGVFLLKRLAPSRSDPEGMRFQHRILRHLTIAGFPVAELQISNDNATMVSHESHYYELCRWVEGQRYQFQIAAAKACGAAMAAMHDLLVPLIAGSPDRRGYHDRPDVAHAVAELASAASDSVQAGYLRLGDHLRQSRRHVRGYWPGLLVTVVHGDWHPGNILLGGDRVVAVIDFESARVEPRVADLANGLMQFTLSRRPGSSVDEWPIECNMDLLEQMANGFQLVARRRLDDVELDCIPSLMIEALATEIVITLRRKGQVRKMGPDVVLPWIIKRLDWIDANRAAVIDAVANG